MTPFLIALFGFVVGTVLGWVVACVLSGPGEDEAFRAGYQAGKRETGDE